MDKSGEASNLMNHSFNLFPFFKTTPNIHLEKHCFSCDIDKVTTKYLTKKY